MFVVPHPLLQPAECTVCFGEKLWGTTEAFHDLPEALCAHGVESCREVDEGHVLSFVLLSAFLLMLPEDKHHGSASVGSEAALNLQWWVQVCSVAP